jgi:hypothetical protein
MWGSCDGEYEDGRLLGCSAMLTGVSSPTFQRSVLPPSSLLALMKKSNWIYFVLETPLPELSFVSQPEMEEPPLLEAMIYLRRVGVLHYTFGNRFLDKFGSCKLALKIMTSVSTVQYSTVQHSINFLFLMFNYFQQYVVKRCRHCFLEVAVNGLLCEWK